MAFFRKAGNILGGTVSNYISQEISSARPSIFQAIRYMSSSKLFIGGLSYSTDDMSLREAFNKYGEVAEARVIVDRDSGRSRGFGFVTYSCVEEASAAIQALDQQELHGRRIRVDYANDRVRGFGGGGFRGGSTGSYSSGGFGGSYGTSGGYNTNDGHGGNYGVGGNGHTSNSNDSEDSYGSGTGSQGSSNYASNNSYAAGNLSYDGDGQNCSIASGSNLSLQSDAGVGGSGC